MEDDRLARLVVLRDQLQDALSSAAEVNPNMLPQLAGQYRATLVEISELVAKAPAVKSTQDQLRERREQKQQRAGGAASGVSASAPASVAAAKGRQRRS